MPLQLEKFQREPAYRYVAKTIRDKIVSGEIKTGDQLPAEAALAEALGVNRSTVREAIRALEQSGLVRRQSGKKLVASIPVSEDISESVSTALILHQTTFLDLWQVMSVVEPLAAKLASEHMIDDIAARLDANLTATRDALSDRARLVELDVEFHDLLVSASGNKALLLARRPLSDLFYPTFNRVLEQPAAGERLLRAHEKVFDAIQKGESDVAENWMGKHILDFRKGYERAGLDVRLKIEAADMKKR
ncbi:MAG: GntR family transcriptional regulator [Caulobacterales bacterium]|nr:GntR family transcriptional regulator [Caulobacterales bacterium]